jgi:hypothetical protein
MSVNNKFSYHNTEIKKQLDGKIIRTVTIKNGNGYKSVTKYHNGKKVYSIKKPIHKSHINLISLGTFIPKLFADCKCNNNKTRRNK